jgi:uncharacterized protein YdcH (DUF465 family)
MSEAHHDLAHEFPEYRDRIHHLKMTDGHFARLAGDYHDLQRVLHRVEAGIETPSDAYVEDLKKQRLHLKDHIFALLQAA